MTVQIELMAYVAVSMFTIFTTSFMVARNTDASPTEPRNFFLLVGASLGWPIVLPLVVIGLLFFGIARLAEELAGR